VCGMLFRSTDLDLISEPKVGKSSHSAQFITVGKIFLEQLAWEHETWRLNTREWGERPQIVPNNRGDL
jgi:hypothetical protein